jgi:hypothetical protein
VSGTPRAPGELGELREVSAGLRAANARLRELLAAKDAQIDRHLLKRGQSGTGSAACDDALAS